MYIEDYPGKKYTRGGGEKYCDSEAIVNLAEISRTQIKVGLQHFSHKSII